jgi:hypothetical protein
MYKRVKFKHIELVTKAKTRAQTNEAPMTMHIDKDINMYEMYNLITEKHMQKWDYFPCKNKSENRFHSFEAHAKGYRMRPTTMSYGCSTFGANG